MALFLPQRWRRQPQGPVEVDWSNPSLDRVLFLMRGFGYSPSGRDLIGNYSYNYDWPEFYQNAYSSRLGAVQIGGRDSNFLRSGAFDTAGPFTLFFIVNVVNTGNENPYYIIGCGEEDWWDVGFDVEISRNDTANSDVIFYAAGLPEYHSFYVPTGLHAVAITRNGAQVRVYVDGALVASSDGALYSDVMAESRKLMLFVDNAFGRVAMCGLFARIFSTAEIVDLSGNPWQLFKPRRPIIYSLQVGAEEANLSAAQQVGDFSQAASAEADVALSAAHAIGEFVQTATVVLEDVRELSATQPVGAFVTDASAAVQADASAAQQVGAFSQAASADRIASASAAQQVGDFAHTATANAPTGLTATQQVGDFAHAASADSQIGLSVAQQIAAFPSAGAIAVEVNAQANQTVDAFGQTANVGIEDVINLSANQQVGSFPTAIAAAVRVDAAASHHVGEFGHSADADALAGLSAAQQVANFGNSAAIDSQPGMSADQQVGSFAQSAAATVQVDASAAQQVNAFGAIAEVDSIASAMAAQQVGDFGHFADVDAWLQIQVAQQVGAFGQTANATVEVNAQATQQVDSFGQNANVGVTDSRNLAATQQVGSFGTNAQATGGTMRRALVLIAGKLTELPQGSEGLGLKPIVLHNGRLQQRVAQEGVPIIFKNGMIRAIDFATESLVI